MTQPPNGGPADPPPSEDPAPPAAPTSPTAPPAPAPGAPDPAQFGPGAPDPAQFGPGAPDTTQFGQPGFDPARPSQSAPETVQFGRPDDPTQPPGYPPAGYPPTGEPPRKRRGVIIASIALAVVLVLCGGGGTAAFFLLRNSESGEGAAEPVAAVEAFLTAVYTDKDAAKAASLVCAEARNEAELKKKVGEVDSYSKTYKSPRFKWTPPKVDNQNTERAIVSTKLTMTTADEKTADEQLRFTVIQKTGWWVCEVA
jgi:hypothetical protein